MQENILDFKINSLQKLLNELSKKEGIDPKDTLRDMGYLEEEIKFILTEENSQNTINKALTIFDFNNENTLCYEIILNVKVSMEELNSLNSLPCLSVNTDNLNKIIELGMYNDLEDDEKHPLVEKYLTSANVIGAESILFYVPYK